MFRYDLSTEETIHVTPEAFDAVTPAAIDETRVAVATIRQKSVFFDVRVEAQYRHIEVFDMSSPEKSLQITQYTKPKGDHYSPFVMDSGKYIGYHRCQSDHLQHGDDVPRQFNKLLSPHEDVDCLGLRVRSQPFPKMAQSLHLLITSSKPCGWPIAMECVLSLRQMARTASSHQFGTKRRTYCMCVWDRLSNPTRRWRSTPSPMYRVVHESGDCSQRGNSIMRSHPPIQKGQNLFSDQRGMDETSTRIYT